MGKKFKRVFLIVLDSLGIGAMPDAEKYGDVGANTLGHIWEERPSLEIPNLRKLGLGNLCGREDEAVGYWTCLKEKSVGKDTMTGYWEMMGLQVKEPFLTFTEAGFPQELIEQLEKEFGRKIVGNKSASGTEILDEYGEDEIKNGTIIVYTSADSVLQICGHEIYTGLDTLYQFCERAREITMRPDWKVGRIIARPYVGEKRGKFKRTSNRHDYTIKPYRKTVLNLLEESGLDVISVGKIYDIFSGEGITKAYQSKSSVHGMEQTIEVAEEDFHGLCFVNLVDFDALWGHRRDPQGYADELEKFDVKLGELLGKLGDEDLLLLTADHGTDLTHRGTDRTRTLCDTCKPWIFSGRGIKDIKTDWFSFTGTSLYCTYTGNCQVVLLDRASLWRLVWHSQRSLEEKSIVFIRFLEMGSFKKDKFGRQRCLQGIDNWITLL